MKSKKKLRKESKKKIREVGKMFRNLPAVSESAAYINLYQVLQELHFQGDYELAIRICNALQNK